MIFGSKYCFICQCATRIVGIVVGVVVHFVCKSVPQQRPSSNLTDDVASVIGTDQDHNQRRKQMADIFLVLPKQIAYNLSLLQGLQISVEVKVPQFKFTENEQLCTLGLIV